MTTMKFKAISADFFVTDLTKKNQNDQLAEAGFKSYQC